MTFQPGGERDVPVVSRGQVLPIRPIENAPGKRLGQVLRVRILGHSLGAHDAHVRHVLTVTDHRWWRFSKLCVDLLGSAPAKLEDRIAGRVRIGVVARAPEDLQEVEAVGPGQAGNVTVVQLRDRDKRLRRVFVVVGMVVTGMFQAQLVQAFALDPPVELLTEFLAAVTFAQRLPFRANVVEGFVVAVLVLEVACWPRLVGGPQQGTADRALVDAGVPEPGMEPHCGLGVRGEFREKREDVIRARWGCESHELDFLL
jgi:hypothetical protein